MEEGNDTSGSLRLIEKEDLFDVFYCRRDLIPYLKGTVCRGLP